MPGVLTVPARALGILLGITLSAACHDAGAATRNVDCVGAPTTALGTGLAAASFGDTIAISGTCTQDVTITTSGLTLTVKAGDDPQTDGIAAQVEIAGAQNIVINGLLLGVSSGTLTFASPSDQAILYVHDSASVNIESSTVSNSALLGILAERGARVSLIDSTVISNGLSFGGDSTASPSGFGIRAIDNSSIYFQTVSIGVFVELNQGGGVALINNSSLIALNAASSSIDGNGGQQIYLTGSSSVRATNVTINGNSCPSACGDTIDAFNASNVRIDGASSLIEAATNEAAILVSGGSTLLVSGVTVFAPAGTAQVIRASDNSIIALAGGNTICSAACSTSTSGTAVTIDHVSTLIQVSAVLFGYTAAQDMLFGNGIVQLQSTVDLGVGLISGLPSLAWTVQNTASNGISVAQNSSFRLEGGATISNSGGVQLGQGSNGFFNTSAGGTNTVNGGVICPFTNIPSAHVVAGNTNALSPTPPFATSFDTANAALHQCLPF
jgi:hypothetical protein